MARGFVYLAVARDGGLPKPRTTAVKRGGSSRVPTEDRDRADRIRPAFPISRIEIAAYRTVPLLFRGL